ncbi:hypothetical protein [Nonomuraea typhae]|uniref:hypothetical protein n=1 Tax=Nonomuraea typhae TaxID=2603600 RepID=UPI0012F75857|nr:hypothetical protein [Nonomuraea typhae]
MTGFLGEVGKRLAERWVALLALPGLLYLAVAAAAGTLGQQHSFDYVMLSTRISDWASAPALRTPGGLALAALAAIAGSVGVGLAAAVLGWLAERLWSVPGSKVPGKWIASWRRSRSRAALRDAERARTAQEARDAIARAERICPVEAELPSWIGDRFRACRLRVLLTYGLDLDAVWPRIWLLLSESTRTEMTRAADALTSAARLGGWAVVYLLLAWWWWPATIIAAVTGAVSIIRSRQAVVVYTGLAESVIDLHSAELAVKLGLAVDGTPVTRELGMRVTSQMRKGRWDPNSPMAEKRDT